MPARAAGTSRVCLTIARSLSLGRVVTCTVQSYGERRECVCGQRLSGKAKRINNSELCGPCVGRYYRGQPQLRKGVPHVRAAPRHAAAAAAAAAAPAEAVVLQPPPGVRYATRHACSAPSAEGEQTADGLAALAAADSAMADAAVAAEAEQENLPPSLLHLTTAEAAAAQTAAASKAAGMAKLRQPGVSAALRHAMHVEGAWDTPLSSEMKSRLAERYMHTRVVVDAHTAGALLYESFTQHQVFIMQQFPASGCTRYAVSATQTPSAVPSTAGWPARLLLPLPSFATVCPASARIHQQQRQHHHSARSRFPLYPLRPLPLHPLAPRWCSA